MAGRAWRWPSARSHALSRSRCLTDLTTEGLALVNSIRMLAEFDHVAGRNTAGCAMEKIAIDHGAKLRRRQGVVSPHQISDFEAAVFADGFQRRDHMGDTGTFREWQQQPFIGNDPSIDVSDIGDGVDGKRAGDAFVVNRHYDGHEAGRKIFVEISALAGVAIGGRYTRAVTPDRQARRQLCRIDR